MSEEEKPFLDLIEEELSFFKDGAGEPLNEDELSEDTELDDECLIEMSEEELASLAEELEIDQDEMEEIVESTRRRVTSTGQVSRVASPTRRRRQATRTTGMSPSERRRRARRSARTRRRNPAGVRKSVRRRSRAMRKRRSMGLS